MITRYETQSVAYGSVSALGGSLSVGDSICRRLIQYLASIRVLIRFSQACAQLYKTLFFLNLFGRHAVIANKGRSKIIRMFIAQFIGNLANLALTVLQQVIRLLHFVLG